MTRIPYSETEDKMILDAYTRYRTGKKMRWSRVPQSELPAGRKIPGIHQRLYILIRKEKPKGLKKMKKKIEALSNHNVNFCPGCGYNVGLLNQALGVLTSRSEE